MHRVEFITPDGELIPAADAETVLELMRTKDGAYWNSHLDTGFATLRMIRSRSEAAHLVFTMKDEHGFHMKYTECTAGDSIVFGDIAIGCDDYETVVKVNLADSTIFLPQAYFVSLAAAEEIVNHFFHDGSRTLKVVWKSECELDWDIEKGRRTPSA